MKLNRLHFPSIDSTNTWAKQHAAEFDRGSLTLVTADEQSAGRGRFSRTWVSPAGHNLYATFVLFQESLSEATGHLPQVLALSAVSVLQILNFTPRIKWPNDVLLSEKKVAGILAETTALPDALAVIIGIGININMPLDQCTEIDRPATSLFVESGEAIPVESVADALATQFLSDLQLFESAGFTPFLNRFQKLITPPHPMISFSDGRKVWYGKQMGVDAHGALLMELPDGSHKTFHAGEILFNEEE